MSTHQRHPHGEAHNIISFSGNSVVFDESKLSHLLLHPVVKDREVAIISIVGAYRKGKSFLMDYCLRYMYANFQSLNKAASPTSSGDWIGPSDQPLTGFSWRAGSVRDTTGLSFWSDVFLVDNPTPLAILLVDTQGLFDPETSSEENAKILTLSTLLSSSLILNLKDVVQEDQLQYLQFATEFAKFSSDADNGAKPFQKFLFLVRDWQNTDDFDFGMTGGRGYLDQVLASKPGQSEELKSVRDHLRECFDELLCCLMPYPGKRVATASDYDGRWSAMDEDFLTELRLLIENFFASDKITAKKVNGVTVKAGDFFDIVKDYVTTFSSPQGVPNAKTLYELTVGKFLSELVQQCFETYEENLKGEPQNEGEVDATHQHAVAVAMAEFARTKKMGGAADEEKYRAQLQQKINAREVEWKAMWIKHIKTIGEQKAKAEAAAREAEQFRLAEEERRRKEEELKRRVEKEERENRERQEEIRRQQERIEEEKRRQREAEEASERERERIRELERERARIEQQIRDDEERRRRLFKVDIKEIGINFDVPKPKCSVM